jgi:hypothetical protein
MLSQLFSVFYLSNQPTQSTHMRRLLLTVLTFWLYSSAAQTWTFKTTGNDFDGRIRTATVLGRGGESPYTTPLLVVNYFEESKSLNFYVTDFGFTGCRNNRALLVIDGTKRLTSVDVSDDSEHNTLFLDEFDLSSDQTGMSLSKLEVLQLLKTGTKLSVRLSNDCFSRDYTFSLSGSTSAINHVLGTDFNQALIDEQRRREEFRSVVNTVRKMIAVQDSTLVLNEKTTTEVVRIVQEELNSTATPLSDIKSINIIKSDWSPGKWQVEVIVWFDEKKETTYSKKIVYPTLDKVGNELVIF